MVLITPSSSHRSSSISSCSPTSFTPSSSNSDVPYTRTTRCPSAWTQTHDRPEGSGTTLISTVTSWVSSGAPPVMSLMSTPRVPVGDVERLVLGHLTDDLVGSIHLGHASKRPRKRLAVSFCVLQSGRRMCPSSRPHRHRPQTRKSAQPPLDERHTTSQGDGSSSGRDPAKSTTGGTAVQ